MNKTARMFVLGLSVIMVVVGASASISAEGERALSPVDSLEQMIRSLADPFISQLPRAEEKKPVESVEPVRLPVVTAPVSRPTSRQPVTVGPVANPPVVVSKPEESVPAPELKLKGIIYNTARPQAIINDMVVGVGSKIAGGEVTVIEKGLVKILWKGKPIILKME